MNRCIFPQVAHTLTGVGSVRALCIAAALVVGCLSAHAQMFNPGLSLYPFVYFGRGRSGAIANGGLDLAARYRGVNFLGSINPDFANVPRDILSLDFSYFERLPRETRPFFLSGREFFRGVPLATQRIEGLDAGGKLFGTLDRRTSFGVLDTADFWQSNVLAASFTRQLNDNFSLRLGESDWHEPLLDNSTSIFGANYAHGGFEVDGEVRRSEDNKLGHGLYQRGLMSYQGSNWSARVGGARVDSNYFDRLDYYTETGIKGLDASIQVRGRNHTISAFGASYDYLDGTRYRRLAGVGTNAVFPGGYSLFASYRDEHFLNFHDHLLSASLEGLSVGIPVTISGDVGNLAGHAYANLLAQAEGARGKLSYIGSLQHVRHFENRTQAILGFRYGLGKGQSVGGRIVSLGSDTGGYLEYLWVPQRGPRYSLIVGDPNSRRWEGRLVLKVVLPLEVRF